MIHYKLRNANPNEENNRKIESSFFLSAIFIINSIELEAKSIQSKKRNKEKSQALRGKQYHVSLEEIWRCSDVNSE